MNKNWSKQHDEPVDVGVAIQVDALAIEKFWRWVDLARGEVSGLGLVEEIRNPNNGKVIALIVTDIYLVTQNSSEAETEMTPEGITDLILRLVSEGIEPGKLRFWIHSHGNMEVFWSSTDNQCIQGLCNEEWMLSLVVNKHRDSLMRLDQYHPAHFYMNNVRWNTQLALSEEANSNLAEEFKLKVNEGIPPLNLPKSSLGMAQSSMPFGANRLPHSWEEDDDEAYWAALEREADAEMEGITEEELLAENADRSNNGR